MEAIKNGYPIHTCVVKLRYASFVLAEKRAKRFERSKGGKLYPYLCPVCDAWHLSKKRTRI